MKNSKFHHVMDLLINASACFRVYNFLQTHSCYEIFLEFEPKNTIRALNSVRRFSIL